jgi:hypothetical protein
MNTKVKRTVLGIRVPSRRRRNVATEGLIVTSDGEKLSLVQTLYEKQTLSRE